MSNEPDEALEERLERLQRRAENFRELLKDGEEITVVYLDGEVTVEESSRSKFERKHPKLFGRLLSLEAQLESGWVPYFLGLLLLGVFLFGLQLSWWEGWLGKDVCDALNSTWFYIVATLTVLYVISLGCGQWQKSVYRGQRRNLLQLIAAEKLDRDILLVLLRDVSDLDNVTLELKLDAKATENTRETLA